MDILIAGGTGFVGSALSQHLRQKGHCLTLLTRQSLQWHKNYENIITWDELPQHDPSQFDAIINLCGENIAQRWIDAVKQRLLQSRLTPTQKLIDFIGEASTHLVNASAIGFYPYSALSQSEERVLSCDEAHCGFAQELVSQWEALVEKSELKHKTIVRFGVVLGDGGMLAQLKPSAQFGLGAVVGSGKQLLSWIHIQDLCRVIEAVLTGTILQTTLNATAPHPVPQKTFANRLSKTLHRPRWLALPAWFIKLSFGQMGEELLLSPHNILPSVLHQAGFEFRYPTIEDALSNLFAKENA